QLMTALSNHPGVPDHEDECVPYFKSVISELPIYREAALVDKDGKFHCSTVPIPAGLDVRDRVYFRGPLQTGRLTVGTLVQGRVTQSSSIHLSMPYHQQNGGFEGIIVVVLNPERMAQELARRIRPTAQVAMVLDREGELVFTLPPERRQAAEAISTEIFQKVSDAPSGTMIATGAQGRRQIVGYVPLSDPPTGLFIAVASDREDALA